MTVGIAELVDIGPLRPMIPAHQKENPVPLRKPLHTLHIRLFQNFLHSGEWRSRLKAPVQMASRKGLPNQDARRGIIVLCGRVR